MGKEIVFFSFDKKQMLPQNKCFIVFVFVIESIFQIIFYLKN